MSEGRPLLFAFAVALAVAGPSTRAEEPEFQIVGTVDKDVLSLSILPRLGYRLGSETPVLVRLQGSPRVELPRTIYRRADAVDPRAEAPRFEVPFHLLPVDDAHASAPARIDAALTFYICKAARCRPVVTRYGTSL